MYPLLVGLVVVGVFDLRLLVMVAVRQLGIKITHDDYGGLVVLCHNFCHMFTDGVYKVCICFCAGHVDPHDDGSLWVS